MELSQKYLTGIQKLFLFQVPMNIQKDWKAKLESAYSFMLKYSKITVCQSFTIQINALRSKGLEGTKFLIEPKSFFDTLQPYLLDTKWPKLSENCIGNGVDFMAAQQQQVLHAPSGKRGLFLLCQQCVFITRTALPYIKEN